MTDQDAIVVGAGPNGLAAAVALARAGSSARVLEAQPTIGGGTRSAELTLPGFTHDICSAIHPLAAASPFFSTLPLREHGLTWVQPAAPLAHPFDDGSAALLERSTIETGEWLGADATAYRKLMDPLVAHWQDLLSDVLAPTIHRPHHPLVLARFGMHGIRSARALAHGAFEGERARALFAGLAGHSLVPLEAAGTAAFGLLLALLGHAVGWPVARGGSQAIADALVSYLHSLGGDVITDTPIGSLDELSPSRAVLLDLTPRQLVRIAGPRLQGRYRRRLAGYRYGPGIFKVDWALAGPIPWNAPECARAATLHLAGNFEEIAASERASWEGRLAERPFVILAQPTLFDASRAPAGRHTAWAYCHVPHGSDADMTDRIEAQVERFAAGFRELILARHTMDPAALERHDANLIGGDIGGGANTLRQVLFRPLLRRVPYSTPLDGVYICSASTPPGAGVHGMCGYNAALAVLHRGGT